MNNSTGRDGREERWHLINVPNSTCVGIKERFKIKHLKMWKKCNFYFKTIEKLESQVGSITTGEGRKIRCINMEGKQNDKVYLIQDKQNK
jgi:hypothetical protein